MIAGLDPEIAATRERADEFLADERVRDYLLARHKAVTTQATLVATSYKEGRAEGIEIGIGQGRAEGIEIGIGQGRAEGLAEGLEKGRAEKTIELAKSCLLNRFGQLSPAIISVLEQKAKSVLDEAECDRIFELALDCASLEEFEASL